MSKMRVVGWKVQPIIMSDDGENLVPVEIAGQTIPLAHWEEFKSGGDINALESIRKQIEVE